MARTNDGAVLFSETKQQLFALNATADLVWRGLEAGCSCAEVADAMPSNAGAELHNAIEDTVRHWLSLGVVAPAGAYERMAAAPEFETAVRIETLLAVLRSWGGDADDVLDVVGRHLITPERSAGLELALIRGADGDIVFLDGASLGLLRRDQTAPFIKAILTERFCSRPTPGFLVHGALVSIGGCRLMLTAPPGVGKTTLTLALCAHGFDYGGDDIIDVDVDGAAVGVPFPAAVKAGAWDLLASYFPRLREAPVFERPDRKLARYLTPSALDRGGRRPLDAVLVLERSTGAKARIEPISVQDALVTILDSGYSARGSLSLATFEGLSRDLGAGVCARIVYEDLAAAVAAIKGAFAPG